MPPDAAPATPGPKTSHRSATAGPIPETHATRSTRDMLVDPMDMCHSKHLLPDHIKDGTATRKYEHPLDKATKPVAFPVRCSPGKESRPPTERPPCLVERYHEALNKRGGAARRPRGVQVWHETACVRGLPVSCGPLYHVFLLPAMYLPD